jgi:phage tail-like protein
MKTRTLLRVLVAGSLVAIAVVGARATVQAASSEPPQEIARYSLTVDGQEIASFSELERLSSGLDAVDLVTTGEKQPKTLLPAKRAPDSIVLTRGLTSSLELQAWHELVILGDIAAARKSCSLTMFNTKGDPVARYHLENAWPSKLLTRELKAGTTKVLTETVTLVVDEIQRVAP